MEIEQIGKELDRLKAEIEKGRRNLAILEGRKVEALSRLKMDFHCRNIEEAEKKLKVLQGKTLRLSTEIEKLYKEIEGDYEW